MVQENRSRFLGLMVWLMSFVPALAQTPNSHGQLLPANSNWSYFVGDKSDGKLTTGADGANDGYHSGGTSGNWSMQLSTAGKCYDVFDLKGQLTNYVLVFTAMENGSCYSWEKYKVKRGPTGIPSVQPADWTLDLSLIHI